MERPLVHVLVAAEAPVAVVVRGGPVGHWRVLRWELDPDAIEPGAAFEGTLYPDRSALHPDGAIWAYFATTRQRGDWGRFLAVAKVPWLTALAAWRWPSTGGFQPGAAWAGGRLVYTGVQPGPPFAGRAGVVHDFGAVRLPGAAPGPDDARAAAVLAQRHPERAVRVHAHGDRRLLEVRDGLKPGRPGIEDVLRRWVLATSVGSASLERVQWAGWTADGRILAVTNEGVLQVRDADGVVLREVADVSDPGPDRVKSPEWARRW